LRRNDRDQLSPIDHQPFGLAASKTAIVPNALLEFAHSGFKPGDHLFGLGQLPTLVEESVLEFTDPLLKTHSQAWTSAGLNHHGVHWSLLLDRNLRPAVEGCLPQSRLFATRAIDQSGGDSDLTDPLKFEQRFRRGRTIENALAQNDQPVHLCFWDHRSLRPNYLIGRQRILRIDLGGVRPFADFLKRNRSENLTALVLSQKPIF
jgi:hypothetical protein